MSDFQDGDWVCYVEPPYRIGQWELKMTFSAIWGNDWRHGRVRWCDTGECQYGGREIQRIDAVTALAILSKHTSRKSNCR
jgi:hypothetical protein